jgi:uncharacterized protein YceH (UPF0502 family)
MELSSESIRVLGCLIEKEATTPDNYPLSTNALLTACNQSTNRDPVVRFTERVVDQTLLDLRGEHLARTVRGDGQRVHKHKHVLDEAWQLSRGELAVLSLLMLRGAQTSAEMRQRTERYGLDLDTANVEAALDRLAGRGEPLVRQLPRRPGEREERWIHLLDGGRPAETPTTSPRVEPVTPSPGTLARSSVATGSAIALPTEPSNQASVTELRSEVMELRSELETLRKQVHRMLEALGEDVSDG